MSLFTLLTIALHFPFYGSGTKVRVIAGLGSDDAPTLTLGHVLGNVKEPVFVK